MEDNSINRTYPRGNIEVPNIDYTGFGADTSTNATTNIGRAEQSSHPVSDDARQNVEYNDNPTGPAAPQVEYTRSNLDNQPDVPSQSGRKSRKNFIKVVSSVAGAAVLIGGAFIVTRSLSGGHDNVPVAVSTTGGNPGGQNGNSDPTTSGQTSPSSGENSSKGNLEALMSANLCDSLKAGEQAINPSMTWECDYALGGTGMTKAGLEADGVPLISVAVAPQGDKSGQLLYKHVDGFKNYSNGTYVQSFQLKDGTNCDWVQPDSPDAAELQGKVSDAALDCFSKPGPNAYQVEVFASSGIHDPSTDPSAPNHRTESPTYFKIASDVMSTLAKIG